MLISTHLSYTYPAATTDEELHGIPYPAATTDKELQVYLILLQPPDEELQVYLILLQPPDEELQGISYPAATTGWRAAGYIISCCNHRMKSCRVYLILQQPPMKSCRVYLLQWLYRKLFLLSTGWFHFCTNSLFHIAGGSLAGVWCIIIATNIDMFIFREYDHLSRYYTLLPLAI